MVIRAAVCLLLCCSSLPTVAQTEMFLKLAGIEGESRDSRHAKEIDVLAWSWGLSRAFSQTTTGRVSLNDFYVGKYLDRASPALMQECSKGTRISSALLACRSGGGTPLEFIKIGLSNLVVTGVYDGGSSGEERLAESVSFGFSRIKFDYFYFEGATLRQQSFTSDLIDSDGDGMPDDFEDAHGLNKNQNDAAGDKDGDGMSNYDEYLAGTSPSDRNSIFKCTLVYERGRSMAVLSWNSIPGRRYRVNYTENVGEPLRPLGDYTAANSNVTEINVPVDLARRFFRVQVSPLD